MSEDLPRPSSINKHSKIMNILSKVAVTVEPVASARLAAAIVYKNDIISFGVNRKKSHPFQAQFCKNDKSIYLHAETDAIKNALRVVDQEILAKSTLYICRMKHIGTNRREFVYGLSYPCSGCMKAIATFNIKNVVYSLEQDDKNSVAFNSLLR